MPTRPPKKMSPRPSRRHLRRCGIGLALATSVMLGACTTDGGSRNRVVERDAQDRPGSPIASLRFIGEQRLAWKQGFEGTTVGGLSGIDYNAKTDTWIMESDDRSAINPARFYTARLRFDAQHFEAVNLNGVGFFKQADGSTYPSEAAYTKQGASGDVPDIETIRFDPLDGSLWYASEGDVKLGLDPFIRHARADGQYLSTLPLPAMFKVAKAAAKPMPGAPARTAPAPTSGVRDNLSFEGLTFAPDGQSLWVSTEAPLYQDGPVPTTSAGAHARITRYDRGGKVLQQVAYPLDAIPLAPGKGKAADNGISEILTINDHQLFVIERAGVQAGDDSYQDFIRLYEMDTRDATDISSIASLRGASYTPARKRLILDLNTLGLPRLDNIEGIAWGPTLKNGHDTLVLVSDDNFHKTEVTQFLLFEVMPTVEHWRFKNPIPGLLHYFDR